MSRTETTFAVMSILFCGAIFGFFYAWVCSTMWGLDATDPRVAIAAMQAMNGSVRNAVFFPAFFLTPVVLAVTAAMFFLRGRKAPAGWFVAAALVYLVCGLLLTMSVNVPMNEALAVVAVPGDIEAARTIWQDYSERWQFWNQVRTAASGLSLALAAIGLVQGGRA
ncbi:MAG: anthrone oxygenase family protein [Neoaquamicrobium sediminum]|uniref:anthrone oxygenase family protein n=1 Tax=Neoaquamicrobium sediminum TaxID=1849104 RepID=UPI0040362123